MILFHEFWGFHHHFLMQFSKVHTNTLKDGKPRREPGQRDHLNTTVNANPALHTTPWLQVSRLAGKDGRKKERRRKTASAHCYWARVHARQHSSINLVKVIFPVRHCRVKSSLSSPYYKVIFEWAITALRCGVCCFYTEYWDIEAF